MKKLFSLFFVFTLIFTSCGGQKGLNKVVYNDYLDQKILVGKVNRKGFYKKPFVDWFTVEYDNYTPDAQTITALKKKVPDNAKVLIIMGTWCSDSRREVPRLYKVLDEIGFDDDRISVIAVDRNLQADSIDVARYQVVKVPTIIYYHYGYAAGRINETPKISLEKDLLNFTNAKGH